MNAQKKRQDPSEADPAGGTGSKIEPPIQRPDDPAQDVPQAHKHRRREDDPGDGSANKTIDPIKREDPDDKPIGERNPGIQRGA